MKRSFVVFFFVVGAIICQAQDLDTAATETANAWSDSSQSEKPVDQWTKKAKKTQAMSDKEDAVYTRRFNSGASLQTMGRVLSWGGLAASILGSAAGNATISGLGNLSFMVGIPINGVGSGRMVDAANKANPSADVEHRGWGAYWGGWALVGTGIVVAINGASSDDVGLVGTGLLMAVAGEVMWFVGWYKFSASADDAQDAFDLKLGLSPLVVPSSQEGYAKGLQMSVDF